MDDLIASLVELGFTTYEAKAYVALLRKQPAIGYEVSKVAGIPAAKVYEVLTNLKNKNAVMASASDPAFYSPVPHDVLLQRLRKEYVAKIDFLHERLRQVEPIPKAELTWNLDSYRMVADKMAEVIANAKEALLLSLWPEEADLLGEEVLRAQQRGVVVAAGIFGDRKLGCTYEMNLGACGDYSQNRLTSRLCAVVGDASEVVIAEFGKENATGVYTATPSIVLVTKEYIKHDLWGRAMIDQLGEEAFAKLISGSEMLTYLIQNR